MVYIGGSKGRVKKTLSERTGRSLLAEFRFASESCLANDWVGTIPDACSSFETCLAPAITCNRFQLVSSAKCNRDEPLQYNSVI